MENLPIAAITGQFLAFVQEAQSLDMHLGGEFSETASWLVLLKSSSMLPREASVEVQQEPHEAVRKYELDREILDQTKEKLVTCARVPAPGGSRKATKSLSPQRPPL
jgi:chromatin segregation and condensation protein Rec8/ScpA/Scc1 (kleisin family)